MFWVNFVNITVCLQIHTMPSLNCLFTVGFFSAPQEKAKPPLDCLQVAVNHLFRHGCVYIPCVCVCVCVC